MCILLTGNLLTIKNTKPQDIISTCPYFKIGKKSEKSTDKVKKLSYIFIFTLLCGTSKGFMKAFKALRVNKGCKKIKT